jgi:ABC-type transport system involved in multi-copper enzyme maturation permease subunit
MNALRSMLAVVGFECRRGLTPWRMVAFAGLAVFPAAMTALIASGGAPLDKPAPWIFTNFVLIPEVVCLLGLLLWATPAIQAEVEGKTWPYLAVRPCGKVPILLGKYLTAVLWTASAAWLAILLALAAVTPKEGAVSLAAVLAAMVAFSSLAYGALFVLIGVVFLRRGMIVAVAYTFIFEFLVSWVPALVNRMTVQYHLRNLMAKWLPDAYVPPWARQLVSEAPPWQHVLFLLGMTAILLTAASLILRRRQLITAPEA